MERKKSKNKVYITKKTIKIWDVNVDNIVVSNLTEIKTNSKYFIEIKFDKAIRPLVLIMPKMSGYVKTLKAKIRTYSDKVYTYFRGSNVPEDDREYESFTVVSIDSLFVYDEKCYLQVFLDNCTYKIVNKQMKNYIDENFFED